MSMANKLNLPHSGTFDVTVAKDYYHLPLSTSAKDRTQETQQVNDQMARTDEEEGMTNPPRGHGKSPFLVR